MKKRILFLIAILLSATALTSCDVTKVVTKIDEEVEVTQISNTIADVYARVSKGCVGIVASSGDSGGTGSGVIYAYDENSESYYVVTNAHVVEDSDTQIVYLGENKYYTAHLIGMDSKNDVAVLKFSLDIFGSKDDIYINDIFNYDENDLVIPGQTVLAIGCPLGIDNFNILTTGVVSSVSYSQISTDAAINPGNSGGGLFNMQGRLIGLNTEKEVWTSSTNENGISQDIAVEGRGYAVSLDVVKKCINDIVAKNGDVERPTFGLSVATVNTLLNPDSIYKNYLPVSDDIVYFIVESYSNPNSNAKRCGVQIYDVLLEINNQKITNSQDILDILNSITLTDKVELKVYRASQSKTIDLTINFTNN